MVAGFVVVVCFVLVAALVGVVVVREGFEIPPSSGTESVTLFIAGTGLCIIALLFLIWAVMLLHRGLRGASQEATRGAGREKG